MKKKNTNSLKKGTITLDSGADAIVIPYQEHPDRNGQLIAELHHLNLQAAQILDLAQQLQEAEDNLAQGRARYANMAYMDAIMTEAFGHLPTPQKTKVNSTPQNNHHD